MCSQSDLRPHMQIKANKKYGRGSAIEQKSTLKTVVTKVGCEILCEKGFFVRIVCVISV